MNETLQELFDSGGVAMRVDRRAGVVRGVKILGLQSRNGRTYLPEALGRAAKLYEGTKVNVNHPQGDPLSPRDYRDRIGAIRNVAVRSGEGLFGDFHFNPKHALAEQLAWDAEHAPENVGFSHNVCARTSRRGDRLVVEAITKVQSVDLVADPATTRGLFEGTGEPTSGPREDPPLLAEATVDDLRRYRVDLVDTLLREQGAEFESAREELDRLRALETARRKRAAMTRLLQKHGLPDPEEADGWDRAVVSEQFVESLLAAPDETAMSRLIEERARLVASVSDRAARPGKPTARDQNLVGAAGGHGTEAFVRSIT